MSKFTLCSLVLTTLFILTACSGGSEPPIAEDIAEEEVSYTSDTTLEDIEYVSEEAVDPFATEESAFEDTNPFETPNPFG